MKWSDFDVEYNKYSLPKVSTWYHREVVGRLTKPVAFIALNLGLSPNMTTLVSFLCVLAAMCVIVVYPKELCAGLVSLLLLQLGYVLDCADGQIARIQKKPSLFGMFFDPFIDRLNNFIVFSVYGCLWFKIHVLFVNYEEIMLYIAASSLYVLYTIAMLIQGYVFVDYKGTMQTIGGSPLKKVLKLLYQFMNMGMHFLLLSIGYILGIVYYVVVFYGILSLVITLGLIVYLYLNNKDIAQHNAC